MHATFSVIRSLKCVSEIESWRCAPHSIPPNRVTKRLLSNSAGGFFTRPQPLGNADLRRSANAAGDSHVEPDQESDSQNARFGCMAGCGTVTASWGVDLQLTGEDASREIVAPMMQQYK